MKKQILIFFTLIMSMMATAQVTIQMEKEGGVYKVPCTVNGVKMKFIFDTGAATVSMSQTMAQFLLDGEYLSKSDIKGTGKSQLADGSIVNHATIVLRDVEIGGMHIHNIDATVIEGQNAPLLLGQSAIQELGRVSIEGNLLIIHSVENELTEEQLEELDKQIDRLVEAKSWTAAIDCLLNMDMADGLSSYGLWLLCYCYFMNHQYQVCISACNRWLSEFEANSTDRDKENIYSYLSASYYFGKKDYNSALLWEQKRLDIWENSDLTILYEENFFSNRFDKMTIANINSSIGDCYCGLEMYYKAVPYYKKAVKFQCQYLDVTMKDVQKGEVNDDELGLYLYSYAVCLYKQKEDDDGDEVMKLSALCGARDAIDFCRKNNISYQVKSSRLFD